MTYFFRPDEPETGFTETAGRPHGLRRILMAAGRLGAGQAGSLHLHHCEEILRILSGEVDVQVADELKRCSAGDLVTIPADTIHGFITRTEVTMEVVAEQDAGQLFLIADDHGERELVEVYRRDMPRSRRPPAGFDWTSDERTAEIDAQAPDLDHRGVDG